MVRFGYKKSLPLMLQNSAVYDKYKEYKKYKKYEKQIDIISFA